MRHTRIAAIAAVAVALAAGNALGGTHHGRTLVRLGSTGLGKVLVTASGLTLYMYEPDHTRKSTCYGTCASTWPPLLTTGAPRAGSGVRASLLGATKRRDGKLQVTYAGHPLYRYSGDVKAGETNGEALGGIWYALSSRGTKVKAKTAPTTTTPTTTGGYGYGGGGY